MEKVFLQIKGLSYSNHQTDAYALLLAERGDKRKLPIVIGEFEAQAISASLEKGKFPVRPFTHDLLQSTIELLGAELLEVNITNFREGIFYAEICLLKEGRTLRIDARVSDAVALALRFQVPVYCYERVMEVASCFPSEENIVSENPPRTSFEDYSTRQLEMMLNDAISEENYEQAALLKKQLDKRKNEKY